MHILPSGGRFVVGRVLIGSFGFAGCPVPVSRPHGQRGSRLPFGRPVRRDGDRGRRELVIDTVALVLTLLSMLLSVIIATRVALLKP